MSDEIQSADDVHAWLAHEGQAAAGGMIMCAPAAIAAGDAKAKGAFEGTIKDVTDAIHVDEQVHGAVCAALGLERGSAESTADFTERLNASVRDQLWRHARAELDRVASVNADNPDKIEFGPRA